MDISTKNLEFPFATDQASAIGGLQYIPNFITPLEHDDLLSTVDQQPWLNDLKRRVQHYGYKYDYKARGVSRDSYLGALPDWLEPFSARLFNHEAFGQKPDQVIVNEYMSGQGISAHIDCIPCFSGSIASLSFGSAAMMQFSNSQTEEKREYYLEPRSLIILSGEARYEWKHSIAARKSDVVNGFRVIRDRRVSLTFRNVIVK